jgi:hypothetical protein
MTDAVLLSAAVAAVAAVVAMAAAYWFGRSHAAPEQRAKLHYREQATAMALELVRELEAREKAYVETIAQLERALAAANQPRDPDAALERLRDGTF